MFGYVSHNFHSQIQNRRAKRNSSGVAVFYKEKVQDGITIVKNSFDTMIWLKLDKPFSISKLTYNVYVCGVYVWCQETPMYI